MSDHDSPDREQLAQDRTTLPATGAEPTRQERDGSTDAVADDSDSMGPLSTSWGTVAAPWGTPGNHLTGPIPRIRRRDDGSLTHGQGEES